MSQLAATLTGRDRAGRAGTRAGSAFVVLCSIQGLYCLVTGVWPLVSIDTFQAVTGPKTDHLVTGREGDHWLVNTVAVLVTANALVLLLAAWRNRPTPEVVLLAVGSALGLFAIDVVYVARDVIREQVGPPGAHRGRVWRSDRSEAIARKDQSLGPSAPAKTRGPVHGTPGHTLPRSSDDKRQARTRDGSDRSMRGPARLSSSDVMSGRSARIS